MPSSFDSMHDEIRPLRMLEEPAATRRSPVATTLASVLLIVAPVLAALAF